ncbi:NAD(P)-dependent oxidoreductase [Leptolyngbya sp. NK1-12]|uniref:NAD(P)-dependent oxidoreductase n=1 Tax=Leptolyngbya sp. NK1-12 TaxID=2547451 RepID=A0AA96WUX3_9CYAN|nr:NAD(P)-dependent oxidoreductase [Leptolyngbya sp. NK1-12]WNZ23832.1 NAD(P)-dependent oxidoreductase [Leptolyngbya sp. NK1-12]
MIGVIGTGLMGAPMAERLLANRVALVAYNRTPEKLTSLQQLGVELAASVPDLLHQCNAVILMLSDAAAIQTVILAEDVTPSLAGRTLIQMGTIGPSESRWIAEAVQANGGEYLEAPVLGSIPEAKAGTLQVMVGATPAQFQQWAPLLSHLGTPVLIGEVGTAAALKLALNQLIAALTTAFGLSLGLVQRQGVEVETFMQILRQSALYAPTFDKKLQRMVEQNYANPNFPTKHLLKDTNLFLTEAKAAGLQVDSLTGVRQILEMACQLGLAEADYSALFAAVNPANPSSLEETNAE